jgi:hypothetical protein
MTHQQATTEEWARSYGISTALTPPAAEGAEESCPFTSRQIAIRAVILQGVVAVAFDVDADLVVAWFRDQLIWDQVSPIEQEFLLDPSSLSKDQRNSLRWRQEAEWALLWVVGQVEALGLPTRQCDTRRLVDEIIPPPDSEIEPFLAAATLRSPEELLAEDDRHYDLWCRYHQDKRKGPDCVPADLNVSVLYERQYAFEWLHGDVPWDDVQCDA